MPEKVIVTGYKCSFCGSVHTEEDAAEACERRCAGRRLSMEEFTAKYRPKFNVGDIVAVSKYNNEYVNTHGAVENVEFFSSIREYRYEVPLGRSDPDYYSETELSYMAENELSLVLTKEEYREMVSRIESRLGDRYLSGFSPSGGGVGVVACISPTDEELADIKKAQNK